MQHFPVTSSILSTQAITVFLQEKYALPDEVQTTLIKAGVNHTYKVVTPTANFVFRIYSLEWRTAAEISEEIRLLEVLQENGLPVSTAVKDAAGHHIQELQAPEGLRYGVLFTFVAGDKLLNFPEPLHYRTGVMMAQMHAVTAGLPLERVTYTPKLLLEDSLELLRLFLPESEELDFMRKAQQHIIAEMSQADTSQMRRGTVHLDIWFDNMAITPDGAISLFDFDFCGNGWLCLDIAYYVLQVHNVEKDEVVCRSKVNAFLEGYESVTAITPQEKRLLPLLGIAIYFFYLGVQCQRFDNWSNTFLNELYLKRFINLLLKKYYGMYNGNAVIK